MLSMRSLEDNHNRAQLIQRWIETIAFWFLGLCNNFGYVVMLSAAHDILIQEKNNSSIEPVSSNTTRFDCSQMSTGAVLLADIVPALIINVTVPFFMHKISYNIRFASVVLFAISALITVGISKSVALSLFGVACASISSGFGEITMLQLTSFYGKHTIGGWSSGTGGAGLLGAFSYAALTGPLQLKPGTAILILLFTPILQIISYIMIRASQTVAKHRQYRQINDDMASRIDSDSNENTNKNEMNTIGRIVEDMKNRLYLVKPLLKYMIPLVIVYLAEYLINQGLYELIYFRNSSITHAAQYRWYSMIYQLGVFISRSSVILFRIDRIWILPIIQVINLAIFFVCVYRTAYIPSIWLVFGLVLFEGLIGGIAYVNTFYKISKEIPEENREFSMGIASIGNSFGITFAGLLAIPVHNGICQ